MPEENEINEFQVAFEKFRGMLEPKEIIRGQVKLCLMYLSTGDIQRARLSVESLETTMPELEVDKEYQEDVKSKLEQEKTEYDKQILLTGNPFDYSDGRNKEAKFDFLYRTTRIKLHCIIKFMQKNNLWLDKEIRRSL